MRQERRRTSKGQSLKKDEGREKAKKADLGKDWLSQIQQQVLLSEKSVFSQNCRFSLGFDIAHPSSLPKAKSVSYGWKVFMFTMFKDANHSPASIFRLACLSVIILPATLKRSLEYAVDGWQLNSLTTESREGIISITEARCQRSLPFLFNIPYSYLIVT